MPSEPLQPFTGVPLQLAVSPSALAGALLALVFLFWAVYTLIAVYHWVKFSHAATVAFPAIVIHFGVSAAIMLFALSGVLLP